MTTIAQLPAAATVGPGDLLPLSQAGQTYSVTVAQLTSNLQSLLSVPTGELLGRNSTGAGMPEAVTIGVGIALVGGTLTANGGDHAGFPVQAAMSLSDDLVIEVGGAPGLLPVTALRGLFSAGGGIAIDANGVIAVTESGIAGPAGPAGAIGAPGPAGPAGPAGATGQGLAAPAIDNSASTIAGTDYVAIWQNGANAWIPYGQLIGGQTINQLPAAAPASDGDTLLVAQGGNDLNVQSFGGLWTYLQSKLPSLKTSVVELTSNTVLDGTVHNDRLLIASQPLTLSANFSNMGSGFSCTLINLSAGSVTMGTGISSGSGGTSLPPGASTTLLGLTYSGGSLVWWSGIVSNAPTLTIASVVAPAPGAAFTITGGVFNDAPTALDYSVDGGVTWSAAPSPVITANAYSFLMPGLSAGTYTIHVRDQADPAVVATSNSFTIIAPTIAFASLPASVTLNAPVIVSGTVSPANSAVQVGYSTSGTAAPSAWVNAEVAAGIWSATITPAAGGTVYLWARQENAISVQAVSGAISVVTAALTVSAPTIGAAGTAISVTGVVTPAGDSVNVQLASQNGSVPGAGWTAASNTGGNFAAALTPATTGTYYAWAQDPTSGLTAVSGAIAVIAQSSVTYSFNNLGGSSVHGQGSVGVNGNISPPQAVETQVSLSLSNTVPPTSGWVAATVYDDNALWGLYYPTPATAGSYYIWVQTASGGSQAVSDFTMPVT
jgi:hypothetical protein